MAGKKKPFRIELGWPGLIFSIGLLICLFLWMFVLGFYFGQKVVGSRVKKLASPVSQKALTTKQKKIAPPPVFEEIKPPPLVGEKRLTETEKPKTPSPQPTPKIKETELQKRPQPTSKSSPKKSVPKQKPAPKAPQPFYSVQVASLRSPSEAQKFVNYLRDKGYEAFYRRVVLPQKGVWYRVYVGRFKSFREAKSFGEKLKAKEKFKAFYIQRLVEQ